MHDDTSDHSSLTAALQAAGDAGGFFRRLGPEHMAVFVEHDETIFDDDPSVLFVNFVQKTNKAKNLADIAPLAIDLSENLGWSHMTVIADGPTWFRDPAVYAFFDRQVDEAFFEDFDRVVFYGTGMGGYAAAAFSVAAPGAIVLTVAPQATLDPERAGWDTRFPKTRRKDFVTRYGYAPQMVEAADRVFVFHDPVDQMDAMHASLFNGPFTQHFRCRHWGAQFAHFLVENGLMIEFLAAAVEGKLTAHRVYSGLRIRRNIRAYLRQVIKATVERKRPYLTFMAARKILENVHGRHFNVALSNAEKQLSAEGRALPVKAGAVS